jgi:hypothetical protein
MPRIATNWTLTHCLGTTRIFYQIFLTSINWSSRTMINWQEMTVHKFMNALKEIKNVRTFWHGFFISPFGLLTYIFDLEDMCLLSNGFKSFGNIFEHSFFMERWTIYHWIEWFLDFLSANRFQIAFESFSNFEFGSYVAEIELMTFEGGHVLKWDRIETRDREKEMALCWL